MTVLSRCLILILFVLFQSVVSAAPFEPGEKIRYNVSQLGLKVGEATLTFVGEQTYQEQKTVLILFHAKGFNFFDEEKIYLNPQTYKPIVILRDLNIFGRKEKIQELYSNGHIKIIKNAQGKSSEQSIDKAGEIDNIYAFIYRYRQTGEFKIKDRLSVHLPTKDITIKVAKQTALNTAGKKYSAFYMESEPTQYRLWFDTSDRKLPLRISGAIGVANTVMAMTGYEN